MSSQDDSKKMPIRVIPPRNKIGTFANAVTALQEGGVMSIFWTSGYFRFRLRIHKSFLPHLRRRIDDLIQEQEVQAKAQETAALLSSVPASKMVN